MNNQLIQADIRQLHTNGFNVFPIEFASKKSYGEWKFLQAGKIHAKQIDDVISITRNNYAVGLGEQSNNLFALDFDDMALYQDYKSKLDYQGIKTWVRDSYRGGQIYFHSATGEVRNDSNKPGLDVLGNSHYAMLPHSVHPKTGEIVSWLEQNGETPLTIDVGELPELKLHIQTKRGNQKLPRVAHEILVLRNLELYDNNNSRCEYSAVQALRGAGYDDAAILDVFREYQPTKYVEVGEKEWIRTVLENNNPKYVWIPSTVSDYSPEAAQKAQELIIHLASNPLPTRTGKTDTKVIFSLCEIIKQCGQWQISASVRQLSEAANISSMTTILNSIKRLIADKLIIQTKGEKEGLANSYEINFGVFDLGTISIDSTDDFVKSGDSSNDVYNHKALGATGQLILKNLSADQGKTAQEVISAAKVSKATVYRKFDKMVSVGLAYFDNALWYRSDFDSADLSAASVELGTFGKTARKIKKNLEARELNNAYIIKSQILMWCQRNDVIPAHE